jgi:hypothetical protein
MMGEFHKTVKIYTIEPEQELLIPLLYQAFESEGIPVQIRSFHDSAYDGLFVGQRGAAAVYVFENDRGPAEKLLEAFLKSTHTEDNHDTGDE